MERYPYSFGASFAVAVLVTVGLYAIKALIPGLEEWAEESFGHAWLYMGVIAVAVFVILGLTPIRFASDGRRLAVKFGGVAIVGAIVIVALAAILAASG